MLLAARRPPPTPSVARSPRRRGRAASGREPTAPVTGPIGARRLARPALDQPDRRRETAKPRREPGLDRHLRARPATATATRLATTATATAVVTTRTAVRSVGRATTIRRRPSGGYGYTPDLSGSPYVVSDEGMMVVDFPSGERRAFPSCAESADQRDPQGRPRTIFYRSPDYWMILRPGQRGRVHGEPPAGHGRVLRDRLRRSGGAPVLGRCDRRPRAAFAGLGCRSRYVAVPWYLYGSALAQ